MMSIGLMLNSTGIHWQIFTKRKPIAIFTNAFCASRVLSYLPFFAFVTKKILEEEEEEEKRGRSRGGEEGKGEEAAEAGHVCYLLFFTSLLTLQLDIQSHHSGEAALS